MHVHGGVRVCVSSGRAIADRRVQLVRYRLLTSMLVLTPSCGTTQHCNGNMSPW